MQHCWLRSAEKCIERIVLGAKAVSVPVQAQPTNVSPQSMARDYRCKFLVHTAPYSQLSTAREEKTITHGPLGRVVELA